MFFWFGFFEFFEFFCPKWPSKQRKKITPHISRGQNLHFLPFFWQKMPILCNFLAIFAKRCPGFKRKNLSSRFKGGLFCTFWSFFVKKRDFLASEKKGPVKRPFQRANVVRNWPPNVGLTCQCDTPDVGISKGVKENDWNPQICKHLKTTHKRHAILKTKPTLLRYITQ